MNSKWLIGARTVKEKQARINKIKDAEEVLSILRSILTREIRKPSSSDYDNPAWAYKQAHDNGVNETLQRVLNILETTSKD